MDNSNLRDFITEYLDCILYGTDIESINNKEVFSSFIDKYSRTFLMLKTNQDGRRRLLWNESCKGLNLPKDVLEKIYYKNTFNIYPRLKK